MQQAPQTLLHEQLGKGVDVRGGLVQDQDARIGQERAGEGYQLPLADAEVLAALANYGFVARGQLRDQLMGADDTSGVLNLGIRRGQAAIANVVANRPGEKKRFLQDHADLRAKRLLCYVADVISVDEHLPAFHVVEPLQQAGNRALPRAGRPNDGDGLPGFDVQVEIIEHGHIRLVAERDVAELDISLNARQLPRIRLVLYLNRQPKNLEYALGGDKDETHPQNRVALITGGAGGVGFAAARRLYRQGWSLALLDLNADRLDTARTQLAPAGDRLLTVVADVSSAAACQRAVQLVLERYSGLDFLVNAAGVWTEGPSADVTEDEWDRVLDVNLKGTFFMCRHCIPALQQRDGAIVNLSSDAGIVGFRGTAVYCASKGGVSLLTKSLALELAPHGVRVNAICPSDIDTPMLEYQATTFGKGDPAGYLRDLLSLYPQGDRARFIKADEIASLIEYLSRAEAAPITGACLSIDFGSTAGK